MTEDNRPYYLENEVVNSLWREYEGTQDYHDGKTQAISSVHPLIKREEAKGLERIITGFIGSLREPSLLRTQYCDREIEDWIDEWQEMHDLLFKTVFRPPLRKRWRKKDVRFGSVGDDELHGVPKWQQVATEMRMFARTLGEDLKFVDINHLDSVCTYLARTHYQFIRIHPFDDGNGRIARVLTDQLGISLGLPPIIAGFPRTNNEKKKAYHNAITACIGDPSCQSLKNWVMKQVQEKIDELA